MAARARSHLVFSITLVGQSAKRGGSDVFLASSRCQTNTTFGYCPRASSMSRCATELQTTTCASLRPMAWVASTSKSGTLGFGTGVSHAQRRFAGHVVAHTRRTHESGERLFDSVYLGGPICDIIHPAPVE